MVRLTVETDVARYYFTLRWLDAQAQILAETVVSYREQVRLLSAQLRTGLVSAIEDQLEEVARVYCEAYFDGRSVRDSVAEHFDLIVKPSQIDERFVHRRPTDAISRSIVGAVLAGNGNKCPSSLFPVLPVTQAQLRTSHEQLTVPPRFHFAQLLIHYQRPHAIEWLADRHDPLLAFVG